CLFQMILGCLSCASEEYTSDGECCQQCGPGFGVSEPCSDVNNTVCELCESRTTYSSVWSHTASCEQCSQCPTNMQVKNPCNSTHDTECQCAENYYMHPTDMTCSQCDICPSGFGAWPECTATQNSLCVMCSNGTFSDQTSAMAKCKPCSPCASDQVVLKACTVFSNTICLAKNIYFADPVSPVVATYTSKGPNVVNHAVRDKSSTVVPIYCSVLGAIIVGLLIYVVCKRYKIWKEKQKHHKSRSSPTKPAAINVGDVEIGRHHGSDSGVFTNVDSGSVANGVSARIPLMALPSSSMYKELTEDKKREIEKQLSTTRLAGGDWKALAKELGFSELAIIELSNSHHPQKKMLSQWAKKEHSTLGILFTALQNINRDDVIKVIPVYMNLASVASLPS
ncbi:tumor necrosis factor receptor superfamily member 16-like, partial [Glandiceps talaboti]